MRLVPGELRPDAQPSSVSTAPSRASLLQKEMRATSCVTMRTGRAAAETRYQNSLRSAESSTRDSGTHSVKVYTGSIRKHSSA